MFTQMITAFQNQFFGGVNLFAEPLIRAGMGNPLFWPTGTIVVEITGRNSGRKINLPVLATRFGGLIIFGTARRNAQWLKNLKANPEVRYWLAGQPHEAIASLIISGETTLSGQLPPQARCLANLLQQQSRLLGISFALLTPRRTGQ